MDKDKLVIVLSTLQMIFAGNFPQTAPSEEEFETALRCYIQQLQPLYNITDQDFDLIRRRLRETVTVRVEAGQSVIDSAAEHKPWLAAAQAGADFFFWKRYKNYLESKKKWTPVMTGNLDLVTNTIIDWLGNPTAPESFQRRGLLLGQVQSGKTAQYTGLINKAVDLGYKLIIVLAGTTENLRRQTQVRLDNEFAGRDSDTANLVSRDQSRHDSGVSLFSGNGDKKYVAACTSVSSDFNKNVLNAADIRLQSVTDPILLVMKKNPRILENFSHWLDASINRSTGLVEDVPLLLLDDEADNASVNTNQPDQDVTATNKAIRSVLHKFKQASYLGITATPYANVFILPEQEDEMLGDDLFPKDFIYALSAPSNYIGAEELFGDSDNREEAGAFENAIELLDPHEVEHYYPPKHTKELPVTELPPSLLEAASYFLLANVIRDMRGDEEAHRSMLVHVSRFINVQNSTAALLTSWLADVKSSIQNYAKLPAEKREKDAAIHQLHSVWDKYNMEELTRQANGTTINWDEVCRGWLHESTAPVMVRIANSEDNGIGLDYNSYNGQGMRVIAVGGNSLSRGLTLEGLMTSYFHRSAGAQDTLMQMGRWFGYRTNYEDLFKLWMTQDTVDLFGYIAQTEADLRDKIRKMHELNKTPKDFGLAVRRDPNALEITARNKMRSAKYQKRMVHIAGHLLETPRLKSDPQVLKNNEDAVLTFLGDLSASDAVRDETERNYFWRKVPSQLVADLVRRFETHPWHLSYQGAQLAAYIEQGMAGIEWDVVLFSEQGSGKPYPQPLPFGKEELLIPRTEKRRILKYEDRLSVSGTKLRVGSGGIAKVGLKREQIKKIRADYQKVYPGKEPPDSAYLIQGRRPILHIHILETEDIDKEARDQSGIPPFLFALGLGFPETDEAQGDGVYILNPVAQQLNLEESEYEYI